MNSFDAIKITNKDLLDELLADDLNDNDGYLKPYSPNDARKTYLESPTFEKEEEDMYRYVHSRLSYNNVDKSASIIDSLEMNNFVAQNNNKNDLQSKNFKTITKNEYTIPQRKHSGSTIDSSASSIHHVNNIIVNQPSKAKIESNFEKVFEKHQDSVDSINYNKNFNYSNGNNFQNNNNMYNNEYDNITFPQQPSFNNNNNNNNKFVNQDKYSAQQYNITQSQQPPLRLPPSSPLLTGTNSLSKFQPPLSQQFIPIQTVPSSSQQNNIYHPISKIPTSIQPQVNSNQYESYPNQYNFQMAYQEYPMYNNFIPPMNWQQNFYPPNYINPNYAGYYQEQPPFTLNPYQDSYYNENSAYQNNYQSNNNNNNNNNSSNNVQSYPIAPAIVPRRILSNAQLSQSQQSNVSLDIKQLNSPLSVNGVEDDEYNDGTQSNAFKNSKQKNNLMSDDDLKRQEVWDKLQKVNKTLQNKKSKPVSQQKNYNPNSQVAGKKPPLNLDRESKLKSSLRQQTEPNYLEKNIGAIRNKENLVHRYPMKSYEKLHNKQRKMAINDYIKQYEAKITRSLPGSSDTFVKDKPLPPINSKHGQSNRHFNTHNNIDNGYHLPENGLFSTYAEKQINKQPTKQYTLKDYRNFMKDALIASKTPGKLGFDYESEEYKEKVEKAQKKYEYAQKIKARNQKIIETVQKSDLNTSDKQNTAEKSHRQRALEYSKTKVVEAQAEDVIENQNRVKKTATVKKKTVETTTSKRDETAVIRRNVSLESGSNEFDKHMNEKLTKTIKQNKDNLNKSALEASKPPKKHTLDPKATPTKRNPIAFDTKSTKNLDVDIEELAKRHEQDKSKVNLIVNNKPTSIKKQEEIQNEDDKFNDLINRHNSEKRAASEIEMNKNNYYIDTDRNVIEYEKNEVKLNKANAEDVKMLNTDLERQMFNDSIEDNENGNEIFDTKYDGTDDDRQNETVEFLDSNNNNNEENDVRL